MSIVKSNLLISICVNPSSEDLYVEGKHHIKFSKERDLRSIFVTHYRDNFKIWMGYGNSPRTFIKIRPRKERQIDELKLQTQFNFISKNH